MVVNFKTRGYKTLEHLVAFFCLLSFLEQLPNT